MGCEAFYSEMLSGDLFLQSDPIGQAGGINTYLYAHANPVMRTDANGLLDIPVGISMPMMPVSIAGIGSAQGMSQGASAVGNMIPDMSNPQCSYYVNACTASNGNSTYYCQTAAVMCNVPYISPFLWGVPQANVNSIRSCLIASDQGARNNSATQGVYCNGNGCYTAPTDQTIDGYHQQCYQQCDVSGSRYPGLNPLGISLGNGTPTSPAP